MISKGYHSFAPGHISIFSETVWVPLIERVEMMDSHDGYDPFHLDIQLFKDMNPALHSVIHKLARNEKDLKMAGTKKL